MNLSGWLKYPLHRLGEFYVKQVCKSEYSVQSFRRFNERPIEFSFVFRKLGEIYPKNVLDIGTGKTALPHLMRNCGFLVTATDNVTDYWSKGLVNRHYHVVDDDITKTSLKQKFDFISCVSVLEHITHSTEAVDGMFSLLKPKGHLILSFPYCESQYVENVYKVEGSSYGQNAGYVTQAYSRKQLDKWFPATRWKIREQEYWQYWDREFWTQGSQVIPPKKTTAERPHQLTCIHVQAV